MAAQDAIDLAVASKERVSHPRGAAQGDLSEPQYARSDSQDRLFGKHDVLFYQEDAFLVDHAGAFVGAALCAGEAAVVIATKAHQRALEERLMRRDLNLCTIRNCGRYLAADPAGILSEFTSGGKLDRARFTQAIGNLIGHAIANAESDHRRAAVFGEIVSLLWAKEQRESAIQVEKWWNHLLQNYPFYLRCGYSLRSFHGKEDPGPFLAICAEHSRVIRGENHVAAAENEGRRGTPGLERHWQAFQYETALERSEERFRLLVDAVEDYAIFLLDTNGRIISWNRGAERIKGYTAAEIIGQPFSVFYPREDVKAGKPERLLRKAAAEGRCEDEGWRTRRDGSRFWANVVITALRDKGGKLRGFAKITRDVTKQKKYEDALSKLTSRLLSVQDEERRRLARELHDSTSQTLAALAMSLGVLQQIDGAGKDPNAAKILRESQNLADQAARDIRNLSHLLHPPDLDALGLVRAIRWFVQRFTERTGIQVDLNLPPGDLRLPQNIEIALFRIMQEALTNVHRHSGSHTAVLQLETDNTKVAMTIEDQGCGFPQPALQDTDGLASDIGVGLASIQERVRELRGELNIQSSEQGTTLRISIPRTKQPICSGLRR